MPDPRSTSQQNQHSNGQSVSVAASTGKRNLHVDFFRGLVLLIVWVDHVEWLIDVRHLSIWTPQAFGFSDAAEGFVFLSGFSFGLLVHRRTGQDHDSLLRRIVGRSIQIYAAFLTTLLLSTLLVAGVIACEFVPPDYLSITRVPCAQPVTDQILGACLLLNQPFGFTILPFYILVLPCAAIMFEHISRHRWLPLGISAVLYAEVQLIPELNLPAVGEPGHWYFNPLAWQFLFVIGVYCGLAHAQRQSTAGAKAPLYQRIGIAGAAAAVVAIGILSASNPYIADLRQSLCGIGTLSNGEWPNDKTSLNPLRILHFLSITVLLSMWAKTEPRWYGHRCARYLILFGRNSLLIYCAGIFFSYVALVLCHQLGTSAAAVYCLHIAFFAICVWLVRNRNSILRKQIPTQDVLRQD